MKGIIAKKKLKKCKIGLVNSSIKVNFKNYSGYIKVELHTQ